MTEAEKIVQSKEVPSKWADAAEEVSAACKQGFQYLEDEDPNGPRLLAHRLENHGLHAYRYEVCGDGSVVALFANTKSGNVKMKSFSDMREASRWSPRDER